MKQIVIELSQAVNSAQEAEQAQKTLRGLQRQLEAAIKREREKKVSPIVRNLNRRIAKGETLYYEFCNGKQRGVYHKNDEKCWRFGLQKDGGLVFGYKEKFEFYTALDRVYKLNLNGKSELIYDATS